MSEKDKEEQEIMDQGAEDLAGCFGFGCLIYIIMFIIMFVCVLFGLHI